MVKDYFGEIEAEEPEEPYARFKDYTGYRFNRWFIVQRIKHSRYLCRCDCGFEAIKSIYSIRCCQSTQCKNCYKKSKDYTLFRLMSVRKRTYEVPVFIPTIDHSTE